jgi:hypothetical protein
MVRNIPLSSVGTIRSQGRRRIYLDPGCIGRGRGRSKRYRDLDASESSPLRIDQIVWKTLPTLKSLEEHNSTPCMLLDPIWSLIAPLEVRRVSSIVLEGTARRKPKPEGRTPSSSSFLRRRFRRFSLKDFCELSGSSWGETHERKAKQARSRGH